MDGVFGAKASQAAVQLHARQVKQQQEQQQRRAVRAELRPAAILAHMQQQQQHHNHHQQQQHGAQGQAVGPDLALRMRKLVLAVMKVPVVRAGFIKQHSK